MLNEYFHLITDPAHGLAEITYTLLFDVLVVGLIWGVFFNKFLLPKIKRDIHSEIDSSHGYSHDSDSIDDVSLELLLSPYGYDNSFK
jgi:hypothetical protein